MKPLVALLFLLSLVACQSQNNDDLPATKTISPPAAQAVPAKTDEPPTRATTQETTKLTPEVKNTDSKQQDPPRPPLFENFQGAPQLSLFPRTGAYRPEDNDTEGMQYWRTFIEHLLRTSGPTKAKGATDGNISFGFRGIKGIDSVGFFSPIAVQPTTRYEIRTTFSCDLTAGATAGIGILEFNKFLWVGEQYPESLIKESQVGAQVGVRLKGKVEKQLQTFSFTTGPKTAMIHLIFFREGKPDRNTVTIDDISIKEAAH
ncbi:hypothetical protein [Geopsychrobacter electrodiphilus]|uniref:hypothetical protein n=1 Tax=Geopsychrobacter electrodiphilus TaxID=225196 RepID=UPI000377CCE1|nr:hypothetical protein [Geopsychrobacter electrodiphilus]